MNNNARSYWNGLYAGLLALCLVACGGGGGGGGGNNNTPNNNTGGDTVNDPGDTNNDDTIIGNGSFPAPGPGEFSVSGNISFDKVPHNSNGIGLDYDSTFQLPARAVLVQAIASNNSVLAQVYSDNMGFYSINLPHNTNYRIQVVAKMEFDGPPGWDIEVRDNTRGNAIYAIVSGSQSGGSENATLNLNAPSGWGGLAYTSTRTAAPFTLLNDIYDTMAKMLAVAPTTVFPALDVFWSENNSVVDGDPALGQLGSSFYSNGAIYVLGEQNSDADEYDSHVVIHEWGHFFEDRLSRADSIGGPHSLGSQIDLRLAFGEGWGNALSAMITDDPFYKDSQGIQQQSGFRFNVADNIYANPGWFSEASVQSLLYNFYDSDNNGADTLSLGLGPIFSVLTSSNYVNNSVLTSIYSFAAELSNQFPAISSDVSNMLLNESINGVGPSGIGETNNGGISEVLPVFKSLSVNGSAATVCSQNDYGEYNFLGNRDFARVTINSTGIHTIRVNNPVGSLGSDPDIRVFREGNLVAVGENSATNGTETLNVNLSAGNYVIEIYDFRNIDGAIGNGDTCYSLSVSN